MLERDVDADRAFRVQARLAGGGAGAVAVASCCGATCVAEVEGATKGAGRLAGAGAED